MKKQKDNLNFYKKWIQMTAKRQIKKPSFYLFLAGVIFLLYLVQNMILPHAENTCIGLFAEDGIYAQKTKEALLKKESGLTFCAVSTEEELKRAVYRGEYDCGFILPEDLDDAMAEEQLKDSVTYVYSTATTKGSVAKESVYAVLFRYLSAGILKEQAENGELFAEQSTGAAEAVLAANEYYLGGDEIFTVNFVEAERAEMAENAGTAESGQKSAGKAGSSDAAAGVLANCVFAAALLYGRYRFGTEYGTVGKKLPKRTREMIRFLQILIPLLLLFVPLTILSDALRGKKILLLMFLSAVWSYLFSACFRDEQKYLCAMLGALVASVLFTPGFFDFSVYVPAVGVLQKVFPVNYFW